MVIIVFVEKLENCKVYLWEETISRTVEGQPRPKYIFNKCGTNIYFFTLQRFGPSPSPNFKYASKISAFYLNFKTKRSHVQSFVSLSVKLYPSIFLLKKWVWIFFLNCIILFWPILFTGSKYLLAPSKYHLFLLS